MLTCICHAAPCLQGNAVYVAINRANTQYKEAGPPQEREGLSSVLVRSCQGDGAGAAFLVSADAEAHDCKFGDPAHHGVCTCMLRPRIMMAMSVPACRSARAMQRRQQRFRCGPAMAQGTPT